MRRDNHTVNLKKNWRFPPVNIRQAAVIEEGYSVFFDILFVIPQQRWYQDHTDKCNYLFLRCKFII